MSTPSPQHFRMAPHWIALMAAMPIVLLAAYPAHAAQPAAASGAKKVISYDHLRDLSRLSNRVYDFRYNVFQFDEARKAVDQYAALLSDTQLVWRVAIRRVTRTEVIYTFDPADRTTVAIIPGPESRQPDSRHSRYRTFSGPPSNRYFSILGAPKTLRIGSQISLDLARQLQRGDYIQLIGDVERIETMIRSGVFGDNLVFVSNVKFDTYSQPYAGR